MYTIAKEYSSLFFSLVSCFSVWPKKILSRGCRCDGFLVTYRRTPNHEWRRGNEQPQSKELFNMRHASTTNVIEHAFGLLKVRWHALAKGTKYPHSTQIDMILACVYIHNPIR